MAYRHDKRRADAYELRDRLRAEGRTKDAQIITDLCRSSATSAAMNRVLQDDLAHEIARRDV